VQIPATGHGGNSGCTAVRGLSILRHIEQPVRDRNAMETSRRAIAALPGRAGSLILPPAAIILVLLAAAEIYARVSGVRPSMLPPPSRVAEQMALHAGDLLSNAVPTLIETLMGFALSMAVAFAASVLLDFSSLARRALLPVFIISQTLPLVAIAPLIVLWFGFGLVPKLLLVALVTFFPMLVALVQGYGATDADLQMLLRTMGASRWKIFVSARLPTAIPYFFTGLRIAITYAVVGAIFAEYAGAEKGLGIYMLAAKNNFRSDLVLAAVCVTGIVTLVLFGVAVAAERLAMPWKRTGEGVPE